MKNFCLLFFVFTILVACSKQTKTMLAKNPILKDYKVGEKWTWKWQSAMNGEVRGEGKDVHEVVDYKGALGLWTGFDTLQLSEHLSHPKSSTPFRDFPLEVGKKWTYASEWTNESGEKGKTSQEAEVISFEKLKVAAGKFMAYKIRYEGFVENYSAGGKGQVVDTYWYCPALKTSIKHVQEGGGDFVYTSELIEYVEAQ